MSDDKVVSLFPDLTQPESFSKEDCDAILVANRDEMLEFLDGMRGRVMAFDIRAITMIGFTSKPSQDVVFQSAHSCVDVARTVGSLEFLKQSIVDSRLRAYDYEED